MSDMLALAAIDLLRREPPRLVAACGLIFREFSQTARHCRLEDSLTASRGGTWGDESYPGHGYPILRSTNMRGSYVDVKDPAWREVPPAHADACALETGDILIIKSSGSTDLVGKAALFVHPGDDKIYLFSNFTMRLRPNRNIVMPEFLAWYLRSPQAFSWRYEAQHTTVGLRNLKTPVFLAQKVPVPPMHIQEAVVKYLGALEARDKSSLSVELPPPLYKQRRIVARIEELAALIQEAQTLRAKAREEMEALWQSHLASAFVPVEAFSTHLEDVCAAVIDNLHSTPEYDGLDFPCIRSQDVDWGTINYSGARRTSKEEFVHRTRRGEPTAGDIVYVREGSVGRCAVVDGSQRFSLGQRVMMFRPNPAVVDPGFLMLQLMSAPVLEEQVLVGMKGTTSHHVNIKHLRKVQINVPSLEQQRCVVTSLTAVKAQVNEVAALQHVTQALLDALLPSVLDRAFRGEL